MMLVLLEFKNVNGMKQIKNVLLTTPKLAQLLIHQHHI